MLKTISPSRAIAALFFMGQLACVGPFIWFSLTSASNHTGLDLEFMANVFVGCSVAMSLVLTILRQRETLFSFLILVLGLAGFCAMHLFQATDIMLFYEDWIQKGMPDKGSLSDLF